MTDENRQGSGRDACGCLTAPVALGIRMATPISSRMLVRVMSTQTRAPPHICTDVSTRVCTHEPRGPAGVTSDCETWNVTAF